MKKIGIIIPTYYEEENIGSLVDEIISYIPNSEIFVVDDTPSNGSEKILKDKNFVHYFHRGQKLGRGTAVIFGLEHALKKDYIELIVEMDADFSHNPRELKEKIEFFKRHELDMLIASRYAKNSKIVNWNIFRRIFSHLSNFLARLLLRIPCTDYTNGFRFYSRRAAETVLYNCGKIGDGFIVLSEILVEIHSKNYKIAELSTTFVNRKRGQSSVSLKLIISSLFGLVKLYYLKKRKHKI
jgi:dolichol-phosphate mannosyltransferase